MASTLDNMSARYIDPKLKDAAESIPSLIISADSHIDEPLDLWSNLSNDLKKHLPQRLPFPEGTRPLGGVDPKIRIEHMDLDGVAAEIIYPTATLRLFAKPREVQEVTFRVYNDWVADYCKTSPINFRRNSSHCTYSYS